MQIENHIKIWCIIMEESMTKLEFGILISIFLIMFVPIAFAEVDTTTVSFIIPSSISHAIGYAASCSTSDFAFVEQDGTFDGTETRLNVTQIDGTTCQTDSVPIINITNTGNDAINITFKFTSALPSGIVVKASLAEAGYEASCTLGATDTPTAGACHNITTTQAIVANNLTALTGYEEIWMWGDMNDFNSGVAATITRTMNSNATQA